MKTISLITAYCLILSCNLKKGQGLFPIYEKNKIGFIDNLGHVKVKPTFRSAGAFSEGLAAARINGEYGYIDSTGKFVIEPHFEYATEFKEGFAVVYTNATPNYIDKQGHVPFSTEFKELEPFENGIAIVATKSRNLGVIDKTGKLVIDTLYCRIDRTEQDLLIVRKWGEKEAELVGLMTIRGKVIVPLGMYEKINPFSNGVARVETYAEDPESFEESSTSMFIDTSGNVLFEAKKAGKNQYILDEMSEDMVVVHLYKYWLPNLNGSSWSSDKLYQGYMNDKGDVVLNDTMIERATGFSSGRAFIGYKDSCQFLIDKKFQKVSNQPFYWATEFENGYAFVTTGNGKGFGMIDTSGKFIFEPQFESIDYPGIMGDYFFYSQTSPTPDNEYRLLYGIANTVGKIIAKPFFEQYDYSGYHNGLLNVQIDGKMTYIDKQARIIWQESKEGFVDDFNIDFMKRGYFYAHSARDENDLGGFGGSNNMAKKIQPEQAFPKDSFSLIVQNTDTAVIAGQWNGYKVFVVNSTNTPIKFNASDSRLYMKVQAQNERLEWKDIEYLPTSWCGNSYHVLTLGNQEYWEFLMPKYSGDFKTKLRVELVYRDPKSKESHSFFVEGLHLYSNEYEGSINKSQFWREQGHTPMGIMDPYNN